MVLISISLNLHSDNTILSTAIPYVYLYLRTLQGCISTFGTESLKDRKFKLCIFDGDSAPAIGTAHHRFTTIFPDQHGDRTFLGEIRHQGFAIKGGLIPSCNMDTKKGNWEK